MRASLAASDPLRALAVAARTPWRGRVGAPPPADVARALGRVAPTFAPRLHRSADLDLPATTAPAWSPLAFDEHGTLFVRTASGTQALDEHGLAPAPDAAPLGDEVASPDGARRLVGATSGCRGPGALRFTLSDGAASPDVELPFEALPGCTAARAAVTPLSWGAGGLEVLASGAVWLVAPERATARRGLTAAGSAPPVARGAARSPDGRAIALGLGPSVALFDGRAWHLADLRGDAGAARAEPTACTAANSGRAFACIEGRAVVWGNGPAPSRTP